ESYIEPALANGLIKDTFSIAQMRPILAVKKGNPLQIQSLNDLIGKDVRISMTDPMAASTSFPVAAAIGSVIEIRTSLPIKSLSDWICSGLPFFTARIGRIWAIENVSLISPFASAGSM